MRLDRDSDEFRDFIDCIALLVLIILTFGIIAFVLITAGTSATATAPVESEQPLTFEEMVKHDEEVAYLKWESKQINEVEEEVTEEIEEDENPYLIEVTEEEIDLMARVVMSECSVYLNKDIGSDVAQAIATTIVNRVRDDKYDFKNQNTVTEVITFDNAYSTQDNGEPTEECYQAVYAALTYEGFPRTMMWFREGEYHSFYESYTNIGSTYFTCRVGEGID